jgi:FkbM family methyltransferase
MVLVNIPGRLSIELPRFYTQFEGYYPDCEPETKKWFVNNIKENWVCFDCGANIGYYTILFAQMASKGWVHSFEPTVTFDMLVENIKYNKINNVNLVNMAVGSKTGKFTEILNKCWGYEVEKCLYNFITIDTYCKKFKIKRIDLIKIDTDGWDFEILMGAKNIINKFHPKVMIEIYEPTLSGHGHTVDNVLEWLNAIGYSKLTLLEDCNYMAEFVG